MGGKRRPSARRGADRFEIRVGTETLVVLSTPIADGAVLEELTPAEREVASAVLRGLSNEEVARLRGCRPRTVAVQLASIYKKLGIASRSELAALVGGSR